MSDRATERERVERVERRTMDTPVGLLREWKENERGTGTDRRQAHADVEDENARHRAWATAAVEEREASVGGEGATVAPRISGHADESGRLKALSAGATPPGLVKPGQDDVCNVARVLWGVHDFTPDWYGAVRFDLNGKRWRATGREYHECVFMVEEVSGGFLVGSEEAQAMARAMHARWFVPQPSMAQLKATR